MTTETIIKAVKKVNEKSNNEIAKKLKTHTYRAATKEMIRACDVHPYCENPALSLAVGGQKYKTIKAPDDITVIDPGLRAHIIDTHCCFYNLENVTLENNGPKLRAAYNRARLNQGVP